MGLVLTLRVNDSVFLDKDQYDLVQIDGPDQFWLTGPKGKRIRVTDLERVQVAPKVFMSSGGKFESGTVSLNIEAPKEIYITRRHADRRE